MIHNDCIFGRVEITEPIILELIKSQALQRLKGIDQGGCESLYVCRTVLKNKLHHNRFAHSLGVYLLLRKFGASLEEQIAGLIHDISHASFSHSIDYVSGDEKSQKEHNHQDSIFDAYIRQTEIPKILTRYGFSPKYIFDDTNFPLKERPLPELCADRIEYSLREALVFGEIKKEDAVKILKKLTVFENQWVFSDLPTAKGFANIFFKMNKIYYSGLSSAIMFRTIGDCLGYSLAKKYINKKDLYTTDEVILRKIKNKVKKDDKLKILFSRMNGNIKCQNNFEKYDIKVFVKSRIVDPLCWHQGKIKKVSDINKKWATVVKEEMKPKEYFLKYN